MYARAYQAPLRGIPEPSLHRRGVTSSPLARAALRSRSSVCIAQATYRFLGRARQFLLDISVPRLCALSNKERTSFGGALRLHPVPPGMTHQASVCRRGRLVQAYNDASRIIALSSIARKKSSAARSPRSAFFLILLHKDYTSTTPWAVFSSCRD